LILFPVFKPVQRKVGCYLGDVTVQPLLFSIDDEIGVVIIALSGKYGRIVESLGQAVQMDLPYQSGLISIFLQQFRETLLVPVKFLDIVYLAIYKTVLSGEHYGPAGRAQGICDKGLGKDGPVLGDP